MKSLLVPGADNAIASAEGAAQSKVPSFAAQHHVRKALCVSERSGTSAQLGRGNESAACKETKQEKLSVRLCLGARAVLKQIKLHWFCNPRPAAEPHSYVKADKKPC